MEPPSTVYLLWHGYDDDNGDTPDAKLLGAYSSESLAHDRIQRSVDVPGFKEHPDDFLIEPYVVDQDHWTDGYVVVSWSEEEVFVRLMDEAVDCWRPVRSEVLDGEVYRLSHASPEGERWEFPPGSFVRCELHGGRLMAMEAAEEPN